MPEDGGEHSRRTALYSRTDFNSAKRWGRAIALITFIIGIVLVAIGFARLGLPSHTETVTTTRRTTSGRPIEQTTRVERSDLTGGDLILGSGLLLLASAVGAAIAAYVAGTVAFRWRLGLFAIRLGDKLELPAVVPADVDGPALVAVQRLQGRAKGRRAEVAGTGPEGIPSAAAGPPLDEWRAVDDPRAMVGVFLAEMQRAIRGRLSNAHLDSSGDIAEAVDRLPDTDETTKKSIKEVLARLEDALEVGADRGLLEWMRNGSGAQLLNELRT